MKIYIRKAVQHDATNANDKEVSITTEIYKTFFDERVSGLNFIGKISHENGSVKLTNARDWRVGGDFKKIVRAEGGSEVNDLYFITTINGQDFELEIIKPNDNRYSVLSSLFRGNDLHILINTQDEAAQANDENELENGKNIIFYGIPGVGKSYTLQNEFKLNERNEAQIKRVVFHADYTHSDFVGQILPILNDENKLEYKFIAGAFTQILASAYGDLEHNYFLIIEEINRGNAPAIFGDIFQLLDRNESGESVYGITNFDISREVFKNKNTLIKIPRNLFILATMNSADQNVFTLDTAFQRRCELRHIKTIFKTQVVRKFAIQA